MQQHPYFSLECPDQRGTLLLTPCPGTLEVSLDQALRELKAAGATALISLMTQAEMTKHRVEQLATQCAAHQLEWFHLPVEDEGAPTDEFTRAWPQVSARVHKRLDAGSSVAVHCKGGSGRTGVIAAHILIERGVSANEAMRQVKALRPNAFVHPVQVDYVLGLA